MKAGSHGELGYLPVYHHASQTGPSTLSAALSSLKSRESEGCLVAELLDELLDELREDCPGDYLDDCLQDGPEEYPAMIVDPQESWCWWPMNQYIHQHVVTASRSRLLLTSFANFPLPILAAIPREAG